MQIHHRFLLAGVMGWPIAHSRSPKIHNHWIAQYGLEGAYVPLPVEPGKLEEALRALPALGFAGCNLTIPHKETALRFMDRVEAAAARIGGINCVVVEPDGSLTGKNYDGFGFIASLHAAAPHWKANAGAAAVIGAGGGARAVVAGLIDAGASEIRLFNRTQPRARPRRRFRRACGSPPLGGAQRWTGRRRTGSEHHEPGDAWSGAPGSAAGRGAVFGAGGGYRICAAGDPSARPRAAAGSHRGGRPGHVDASGASGVLRLVWRHAGSDPGATLAGRGDSLDFAGAKAVKRKRRRESKIRAGALIFSGAISRGFSRP